MQKWEWRQVQHSTSNDKLNQKISAPQRKLLLALWRLWSVDDDDRTERLQWASRNCNRQIDSFNDLTFGEFRTLADILERSVR